MCLSFLVFFVFGLREDSNSLCLQWVPNVHDNNSLTNSFFGRTLGIWIETTKLPKYISVYFKFSFHINILDFLLLLYCFYYICCYLLLLLLLFYLNGTGEEKVHVLRAIVSFIDSFIFSNKYSLGTYDVLGTLLCAAGDNVRQDWVFLKFSCRTNQYRLWSQLWRQLSDERGNGESHFW